jgi:hypothetical protein
MRDELTQLAAIMMPTTIANTRSATPNHTIHCQSPADAYPSGSWGRTWETRA